MKPFAVIQTGGKQYLVEEGQTLKIEKLQDGHQAGDSVVFDKILLSDNGSETSVGAPFVSGAKVAGEVAKAGRGKKVVVIKYKAKSNYFKKRSHRQPFVEVKITKI